MTVPNYNHWLMNNFSFLIASLYLLCFLNDTIIFMFILFQKKVKNRIQNELKN